MFSWKIENLIINVLYTWICASVEMCWYEIKTPDKSLFISQHGKTRLILKFLL